MPVGKCSNCGAVLFHDGSYCMNCGAPTRTGPSAGRIVAAVLLILLALPFALFGACSLMFGWDGGGGLALLGLAAVAVAVGLGLAAARLLRSKR
jgi:hypothetical protein